MDGQPGGLSKRSVQLIHSVLHRELGHAVRWQIIPQNPADAVIAPRPRKQQHSYWDRDQVATLLDHVRDDLLFALYRLALTTGMRRGELLGLRWRDVDLERQRISIRQSLGQDGNGRPTLQEPKTPASIRTIAITETDVAILRKHRRLQGEERLRLGSDYRDMDLVFSAPLGTPINPGNLIRQFKRAIREAGVPERRFHDMRHTHASLMLSAGVHPKIVQERHGHAQISTTLDTYSHALPNLQVDAAMTLENHLRGALGDISGHEG